MSDITAAVGVAQFKKLERIIKQKQKLAQYWDEKLEEIEFIQPPYVNNDALHIYQA
jgi:dTDP-4-amino-4,6-dideoxygalactose transaminase